MTIDAKRLETDAAYWDERVDIDQWTLKSLVSYDPETGILTYKNRPNHPMFNSVFAGKKASSFNKSTGYQRTWLNGKRYASHRLAWLYVYGEMPDNVDHINGDREDNRICNLRSVSRQSNCRNIGIPKDNKTGVMGVRKEKRTGKWTANIRLNRKYVHIGTFESFFDAVCARKSKEIEFGFNLNHGSRESWRDDPRVRSRYNLEPKK